MKYSILISLALFVVLSSCSRKLTVQKRVHSPGWHVSLTGKLPQTKKSKYKEQMVSLSTVSAPLTTQSIEPELPVAKLPPAKETAERIDAAEKHKLRFKSVEVHSEQTHNSSIQEEELEANNAGPLVVFGLFLLPLVIFFGFGALSIAIYGIFSSPPAGYFILTAFVSIVPSVLLGIRLTRKGLEEHWRILLMVAAILGLFLLVLMGAALSGG